MLPNMSCTSQFMKSSLNRLKIPATGKNRFTVHVLRKYRSFKPSNKVYMYWTAWAMKTVTQF